MTWTTAHLLLIGMPAFGLPVGLVLTLAGQGLRRPALLRAGLLVVLAACLLGLLTFVAGERAATEISLHSENDTARIERHAEGAEAARLALVVLALASAAVLVVRRDSGALPWLVGGLVIFGLVAVLLVARAATFGGAIRHPGLLAPVTTLSPAANP